MPERPGRWVHGRWLAIMGGILLLLVAASVNLARPEAALAYHESIYDSPYYSHFRPDGSSRVYLPPQPQPRTPPPPVTEPPPQPPPVPPPVPGEEGRMLALINQARAQAGVAPLQLDPLLSDLARKKSQEMVDKQYFSHYSPTYGYPYHMERQAGIRARYMGAENIGQGPDVEAVHYLFMGSPGHRANILDPRFTDVGIGVVHDRRGVTVTELFIGR